MDAEVRASGSGSGTHTQVIYRNRSQQRRLKIAGVRELLMDPARQFGAGLKKRFGVFESHLIDTLRT